MSTPPKGQAPTLDFASLIALGEKVQFGKFDVGYRVNPSGDRYVYGAAFDDAPTPAFYYLSPNGFPSEAEREKFRTATGTPRSYVYLNPLVGKLLRDAGYIGGLARARGLRRTVDDMIAESRKYPPQELPAIEAAEAHRLAEAAKDDARKQIRRNAAALKRSLDSLGAVAGITVERTGAVRIGLDGDLAALLDLLKNVDENE
jgi:hypothetical protein